MKEKNRKTKMKTNIKRMRKDWQLYLLLLLPTIYLIVFTYGPMYGLQIAFRDYRPLAGITQSEWVGWKWFEKFLTNYEFMAIFKNTVLISLYSMATFPLAVIFALILNSIKNRKLVKISQTVSYIPHFISLTVLVSILNMVFSPVNGVYGNLYSLFGGIGVPEAFTAKAPAFRHLYVWSGVWQNLGWNSIIYFSALSGVSTELHEAAQIDGATRLQRIRYIDLPSIMPTICIMFILRCSNLISVGFEKVYLMQTSLNQSVSEVISTYVYKSGMDSFRNYSYGTAVGLFNTLINLAIVLLVNYITKKASDGEVSLF